MHGLHVNHSLLVLIAYKSLQGTLSATGIIKKVVYVLYTRKGEVFREGNNKLKA